MRVVPGPAQLFQRWGNYGGSIVEATEALENVLYWMEKDGNSIPKPSDIRNIHFSGDQFTSIIVADMAAARRAWDNRSVSIKIKMPV